MADNLTGESPPSSGWGAMTLVIAIRSVVRPIRHVRKGRAMRRSEVLLPGGRRQGMAADPEYGRTFGRGQDEPTPRKGKPTEGAANAADHEDS